MLQQRAGDEVGVPGDLGRPDGVVGGRPAREFCQQAELTPDRLVQHTLVGDRGRAAGERLARHPGRRDAELNGSGEHGGH